MPDTEGDVKADEDVGNTPLHAYKEGREEDIKDETDDDEQMRPAEKK